MKLTPTSTTKITEFLRHTGYIFEMEVVEILKKAGFETKPNHYFLDLDTGKKREMDIIAKKVINGINLYLVGECKQSNTDDWIFTSADTRARRFYYSLKHLPLASYEAIKQKGIFNKLPSMNKKYAYAQNYLTYNKSNTKKSENLAIDECLYKVPKEVVYVASQIANLTERNIFLPVVFFSGDIFFSSFNKSVVTKKVDLVQFYTEFLGEGYKSPIDSSKPISLMERSILNYDFDSELEKKTQNSIRAVHKEMTSHYVINFVAGNKIKNFVKNIEQHIEGININHWDIPPSSE